MQNHDIIFDIENKLIGLVKSNCEMNYGYKENYINSGINNSFHINKNENNNDCNNDIKFFRNLGFILIIFMFIVIIVLLNVIKRIRKNGRIYRVESI